MLAVLLWIGTLLLFLTLLAILALFLATLTRTFAGLTCLFALTVLFTFVALSVLTFFTALVALLFSKARFSFRTKTRSSLRTKTRFPMRTETALMTTHLRTLRHKTTFYHLICTPCSKLLRSHYLRKSLKITERFSFRLIAFLLTVFWTGSSLITLLFTTLRTSCRLVALFSQNLSIKFKQLCLLILGEIVGLGHAVGDELSLLLDSKFRTLLSFALRTLLSVLCHHCGKPQK